MKWIVVYGETMRAWEARFATFKEACDYAARQMKIGDIVFEVALIDDTRTAPYSLAGALNAPAGRARTKPASSAAQGPFTTRGTSHFVSVDDAVRYYRAQGEGLNARATVTRKLSEGVIHIGPPTLGPGEHLTTLDGGARYGIVRQSPGSRG